jgi:hypothetical protein
VARINVCLFCIDIGRSFTIKASMNEAKFDALEQYGLSPLFTDAERAALDYVTELAREKKVDPNTFARMDRYYSERAICEIVWLVASEHLFDMTNIGLNIHSDCSVTSLGKEIIARFLCSRRDVRFGFAVRRVEGGRPAGLEKKRRTDSALNRLKPKGEVEWRNLYILFRSNAASKLVPFPRTDGAGRQEVDGLDGYLKKERPCQNGAPYSKARDRWRSALSFPCKALGPEEGLAELSRIRDSNQAQGLSLLSGGSGEISPRGRPVEVAKHFEKALKLARSRSEVNFFERKLSACRPGPA